MTARSRNCPLFFVRIVLPAALLLIASEAVPQERSAGTAVVRADGREYTIPIECDDPARPELGFSTEPSRVTRETTGRTSGVRLTVRQWQDTSDLVITLDRFVAWVPSQPSTGGVLVMTLDMSPASSVRNGIPAAVTYDQWVGGERAPGLSGVSFEANCSFRDPEAPSFQLLPAAGK